MHALFATHIQNITTLPCKMANDDQKNYQAFTVYQSIIFCQCLRFCKVML